MQNELPSSCKNHPDVTVPLSGCGFAFWNKQASWCHLTGNDCEMSESSDKNVWEKLNTGNTVHTLYSEVLNLHCMVNLDEKC